MGRATAHRGFKANANAISIHALRGEGDIVATNEAIYLCYFNPRPPWGGRHRKGRLMIKNFLFQSTPSVGRATFEVSTMPLRERKISIHALRGEGDLPQHRQRSNTQVFQSTPSVGRATGVKDYALYTKTISIHALRGEGDLILAVVSAFLFNFNPRPPWGGRPVKRFLLILHFLFQSTPSVGRATMVAEPVRIGTIEFQSTPSVGRATLQKSSILGH